MATSNESPSSDSLDVPRVSTRLPKAILTVGFLALTYGLLVAIDAPATGYELSIYRATPTAFWIGVAVAMLAALVVATRLELDRYLRTTALALAVVSMLSILALPILRGYYFYGQGDSLSHLGFARSVATGAASPLELLHPGVHLTTIIVESAAGASMRWAMLLTVLVFFALFFVFVPLCVRQVANTDTAIVVGLFTALLLLPINAVGTHVITHPSSQAILFTPFLLYLLFAYLRQPNGGPLQVTRLGVLLGVASMAILLVHPQETMNLIVVFGTVATIQFLFRRYRPTHPFATQRSLYFQTLFLAAIWLVWAPRSPRVVNRLTAAYLFLFGSRGGAGATEVSGRSSALSAIGGSLAGLFAKLFLAALVFSIIAGAVMAASSLGRLDDVFPERNAYLKYLSVAFVPLFLGTLFVFVGSFGDHYFRFFGYLMMLVTIIAAAALAKSDVLFGRFDGRLTSRMDRQTALRVSLVLFLLLMPLAVMSLHPSPWIYQDNQQVTEQEMTGYRTAYQYGSSAIGYRGIRGGGDRYRAAIYGPYDPKTVNFSEAAIPPEVFETNLSSHYDQRQYVPIRQSDVEREVRLYEGFRYSRGGFRRLETTPGIHRVQSTDEFRLYLLSDE